MIDRLVLLSILTSLSAPCAANAAHDNSATHTRITGVLKDELVGHATFDGSPVLDVTQDSVCATVFTTAAGKIRIDWSQVPNPTFLRRDRKTDAELQHDTTIGHLITSVLVERLEPPITVLYGDCQPQ